MLNTIGDNFVIHFIRRVPLTTIWLIRPSRPALPSGNEGLEKCLRLRSFQAGLSVALAGVGAMDSALDRNRETGDR